MIRHPQTTHYPSHASKTRVPAATSPQAIALARHIRQARLHTVCEEAACPNRGLCWAQKHAAFMILGKHCTRRCAFCNVAHGRPKGFVDSDEPKRLAMSVQRLGLSHVVITSVNRDDLDDGGASHFSACVREIRAFCPRTTIELLVPDFLHALDSLLTEPPDVLNHNIETVPRLYRTMRAGARYERSLRLLHDAKQRMPSLFTKSGMMVGLGEDTQEVAAVMDDLRHAHVDFLTIGQYLRPTAQHAHVVEYVPMTRFRHYDAMARHKGFLLVAASPLTRSSFHADTDFQRLQQARQRQLKTQTSQQSPHATPRQH